MAGNATNSELGEQIINHAEMVNYRRAGFATVIYKRPHSTTIGELIMHCPGYTVSLVYC